jgi:FkbM family methyltransferase
MDVSRVRLVSYADNAEDVLLMRAFHDHPDGFFVDVGAGDPTSGSLVRNLSKILDWTGIHVEPNPDVADRLVAAYPADTVVRSAVGRSREWLTYYSLPDIGGLSTLHPGIASRHAQAGRRVVPMTVPIISLDEVLRKAEVRPGFELLKIDVEGWEEEVLESARLDHWRPRAVVIEATEPESPRRVGPASERLLRDHGYVLALFDGLNQFFARDDEPVLLARLSVPANVFDRFIPYNWYRLLAEANRPQVAYESW